MAPFVAIALILPLAVVAPARPGTPIPERLALLEAREFTLDSPALTAPGTGLTPMQREIKAVLDTMCCRRESLMVEAIAADERPAALARLQWETHMQVLEIQERYALQEGRRDLAHRIHASIVVLQSEVVAQTTKPRVPDDF